MRRTLTSLVDAEERARNGDDDKPQRLTREEVQRSSQPLIDPASLDIFVTWWQFGGMEHGLSVSEVAAMPAALRHDLLLLLGEMGKIRRSRRKAKPDAKQPRAPK